MKKFKARIPLSYGTGDNRNYGSKMVDAFLLEISNSPLKVFYHTENPNHKFAICEYQTGLLITGGKTLVEAINNYKDVLKKHSKEHIENRLKETIKKVPILKKLNK